MAIIAINNRDDEQYYALKDPLSLKRWMCGRCGLIFDYKFDPFEEEHGWPRFDPPLDTADEWEDEDGNVYYQEVEHDELCPRCGVDFSDVMLVPIVTSKYNFGNFTKTTFVVEDHCHSMVVQQIAIQLNKDIMVIEANNSDNVKNFLRLAKRQGTSSIAYFMVDGDNKEIDKEFASESNFIHLDRYCIESYLFNAAVISVMTRRSEQTIHRTLIKTIKGVSRNITKNNKTTENLLLLLLAKEDVIEKALKFLDTSQILLTFIREFGFSDVDKYIEAYVQQAAKLSKLGIVFPGKLVKAIRSAKHKTK